MRLVVTIPAYNEERTVAEVIRSIPRRVEGVSQVEVVVVSDGSTDRTVAEARAAGADEVVAFKRNRGLAPTFQTGLDTALARGADIVVNIDADGQYVGSEIPALVAPLLRGEADIVLGSRFAGTIEEMPPSKVWGNRVATRITRWLSGLPITDAQTGFRAFSREAALRMSVFSSYTYVQETLLQASQKGLAVVEVPVTFRKRAGSESRLIRGVWSYARRAGATILRTYLYHRPLKTFLYIGGLLLAAGGLVGLRVLLHFLQTGAVGGFLPSAILSALLLILGAQVVVVGLLADVIHHNSLINEEVLYRVKREALERRRN
jgi:glycosyltransferase involved in cell wall biosynthesis